MGEVLAKVEAADDAAGVIRALLKEMRRGSQRSRERSARAGRGMGNCGELDNRELRRSSQGEAEGKGFKFAPWGAAED
jgi:hypothetical protein